MFFAQQCQLKRKQKDDEDGNFDGVEAAQDEDEEEELLINHASQLNIDISVYKGEEDGDATLMDQTNFSKTL
jgi:hypothetical protein